MQTKVWYKLLNVPLSISVKYQFVPGFILGQGYVSGFCLLAEDSYEVNP